MMLTAIMKVSGDESPPTQNMTKCYRPRALYDSLNVLSIAERTANLTFAGAGVLVDQRRLKQACS